MYGENENVREIDEGKGGMGWFAYRKGTVKCFPAFSDSLFSFR